VVTSGGRQCKRLFISEEPLCLNIQVTTSEYVWGGLNPLQRVKNVNKLMQKLTFHGYCGERVVHVTLTFCLDLPRKNFCLRHYNLQIFWFGHSNQFVSYNIISFCITTGYIASDLVTESSQGTKNKIIVNKIILLLK